MDKCNIRNNSRGFSLVELLVILSMFGILAGLSIPMLTESARDMKLISDARSIATTASYAKLSAASQMTRYRLSFNLDANQWSVARLNRTSGDYEVQGASNTLGDGTGGSCINFKKNASSAPSGFPAASSTSITFNSRGIPIEGPSAIYLSNQNAEYAITVSVSGKVQFMRYEGSQWTNQR